MFLDFWTLAAIFDFFMISRKPRRYLKTFPDPVASLSFNMGPWRAMATHFIPRIVNLYAFVYLNMLLLLMFFFKNEFLVRDNTPITGVRQMWNDILHVLALQMPRELLRQPGLGLQLYLTHLGKINPCIVRSMVLLCPIREF